MITRIFTCLLSMAVLILTFGCQRDIGLLAPASFPTSGEVFLDGFGAGLDYQAFSNSKLDAISIDLQEKQAGEKSLRITVPSEGDPSGWYAGGAFVAPGGRDLSGYNALTFWAKASMVAPIGLVGIGNDNSGNSLYPASRSDLTFTTHWQKFVVPIPLASKLSAEKGMFQYSIGAYEKAGFYVWFDDIQFENLGSIAHPRAVIASTTLTGEAGEVLNAGITGVTFNINGVDQTVTAAPAYFTLISSNESVATTSTEGKITAVDIGSAEITVKLGDVEVADKITVTVVSPAPKPLTAAPLPTVSATDVISLFSNAYDNVNVNTWNTGWLYSTAVLTDMQIAGDDVKRYTDLNFVGIEFTAPAIDASNMTHFHLDIWTPDPTAAPAAFKVQLVDFGANGVYGGGDDSSHELSFTSPILKSETWVSLDIPLTAFAGLANRSHLAQLVLSGDPNTVYVDNVYLYKGSTTIPTEPSAAAPTPAFSASDVVSLFSNAYTNVQVDTWSATWDNANVADVKIAGDDVKKYTNLVFAGIEFTSQTVDASAMTHFHMDFWTPDPTGSPAVFKIKLVDFGAGGVFGGGDDVEHELVLNATTMPAIATGAWVSLDIPLTAFAGMTTKGHVAQLIISGDPNTVFLDNVLFHK